MRKIMIGLLVLTLLLSGCQGTGQASGKTEIRQEGLALAKAVYPEQVPFPSYSDMSYEAYDAKYKEWADSRKVRREQIQQEASMEAFYRQALGTLLLSGDDGENKVVSPLNIYLALSLLAESTQGESQQQILDLLGRANADEMRQQAKLLWNANYADDGSVTSILANSVWLDQDLPVKKEWLEGMVSDYMASVYQGDLDSEEMQQALKDWLNEQTGGLLKDTIQDIELSPESLLALCSTIYYKASWSEEFNKNLTTDEIFHGAAGDVTCRMMHQSTTETYYFGSRFSSISRSLVHSGYMTLILPDEGTTPEELLADEEALTYIITGEAENRFLIVNQSVPQFDVTSNMQLKDSLNQLGVTDVFTADADFSPVTEEAIFLDKVQHAARVTIDEEGVEAAAFTMEVLAGDAAPPEEEVDFVLDRPFIFLIKGEDGQILFAGIVNQI